MELNDYHDQTKQTDQLWKITKNFEPHILGLVNEVGELAETWRVYLREGEEFVGFRPRIHEELGDILWYVSALSRRINATLEDVALANLEKTRNRWNEAHDDVSYELYDEKCDPSEQLPREFSVCFTTDTRIEEDVEIPVSIMHLLEGAQVGALLDDNAYYDNGYRFHDIFHLAHAACLGWSPVLRSLLKRKRKANEAADRVEDGARAIFTEEGIAAYVHARSIEFSGFETTETVESDILNFARSAVVGLEVETRSPADWERAILSGYRVWNQMRAAGGGVVHGDLEKRELSFEGPCPVVGES